MGLFGKSKREVHAETLQRAQALVKKIGSDVSKIPIEFQTALSSRLEDLESAVSLTEPRILGEATFCKRS